MEVAVLPIKTALIALVLVLGSASSVFARDEIENYSIKSALETADAREKLDPQIKLRQFRNPHRYGVSAFCGFFALTP